MKENANIAVQVVKHARLIHYMVVLNALAAKTDILVFMIIILMKNIAKNAPMNAKLAPVHIIAIYVKLAIMNTINLLIIHLNAEAAQ